MTKLEWIIRPATPKDGDQAQALLRECYSTLLPTDYDSELLEIALPMIGSVRPELLSCGTWYVVEHPDTGEIVGCGGWTAASPLRDEIPHLRHFATSPKYTRKGIARAIWDRSWADVCEYYDNNSTIMEVFSTLTAESFYASLGFRKVEDRKIPLAENCPFPCILMRRHPSTLNA